MDHDLFFERFMARDASYDGRFLTGVLTTGIYCLPSCSAKKPLRRNVQFFDSEAIARESGFRPCRRCRPDHFYRNHDPDLALVESAFEALREDPARFGSASALARHLGVGASKLTARFREHLHDSPASVIRRERVAVAARSLLSSQTSLLDLAADSGFESSSAFYDAFSRQMRMTPAAYRKLREAREFSLQLPEDFLGDYPLRIFGRDTESISERVRDRVAEKALVLHGVPVILSMNFGTKNIRCTVVSDHSLRPDVMADAHQAALRLSGLVTDPAGIIKQASTNRRVAKLIRGREGLRIPQTSTVFESIAWAIVGQQVNLAFAFQLRRTVIELCGTRLGDLYAHPDAAAVARLDYSDLTSRKFSRSKAEYLIDTSRLIAAGTLDPEVWPSSPVTRVSRELMAIRGIGKWSANYIMMRGCAFADCVPLGDTGVSSGLLEFLELAERPGIDEVERLMAQFAPHRSLATFHLWMRKGDPA